MVIKHEESKEDCSALAYGFGKDCKEEDVLLWLKNFKTQIKSCKILENSERPTFKIIFQNKIEMLKACRKLHGSKQIFSNKNEINLSLIHESKIKKISSRESAQHARIIIRNMPFIAEKKDIETYFKEFGPVFSVEIVLGPGKDGKLIKKGCCFVQYYHPVDAARAVSSANGTELCGRIIAVDWAIPKETYKTNNKKIVDDSKANVVEDKNEKITKKKSKTCEISKDESTLEKSDNLDVSKPKSSLKGILKNKISNTSEISIDSESESSPMAEKAKCIVKAKNRDKNSEIKQKTKEKIINEEKKLEKSSKKLIPKNSVMREQSKNENLKKDQNDSKISQNNSKSEDEIQKTVFLNGVTLNTTKDLIIKTFENFGTVDQCQIVLDKVLGVPKGSAFLRFRDCASVKKILNEHGENGIEVEGKILSVRKALTREQIQNSKTSIVDGNKNKASNANLDSVELKRRSKTESRLKNLKSSGAKVNETRICVRNLPLSLDEKTIKKFILENLNKNKNGTDLNLNIIEEKLSVRLKRDRFRKEAHELRNKKTGKVRGRSCGYGFINCGSTKIARAVVELMDRKEASLLTKNENDTKNIIAEYSIDKTK